LVTSDAWGSTYAEKGARKTLGGRQPKKDVLHTCGARETEIEFYKTSRCEHSGAGEQLFGKKVKRGNGGIVHA